jgi:plasmid stabilization system protein ParE
VTDPLTVESSAQAAAQIRAAEAWWRKHRPKAPDALRQDLEHALALLASQPRIGAVARNAALPHVRRLHMARVH